MHHKPSRSTRLTTERLLLRRFRAADADAVQALAARSREHLRRWLPWLAAAADPGEAARLVGTMAAAGDAGREHHFAVIHREDDRLLGGVTLRGAEIGYWLDAAELGRGY